MADAYSLIRQAILDRAIVTARYRGHLRDVCPHVIGHKQGKPKVLLYQTCIDEIDVAVAT
jgi:hypothetical protein